MDYERINELKAKKEKILKSKKKTFTRKDIGGLWVKPTEKRTITIQVKLPRMTHADANYIPDNLFRKFYYRQPGHFAYFLKENKKEEASKVRISLEVEQYFYSKEDVLNRLNEVIEGYQEALAHTCENVKRNIQELQAKLTRYEELLK